MEKNWNVEVWGVRGSAPAAYREFLEYGGNTSCFLVRCGEEIVIFDAGSGLLELGKKLAREGKKKIHILLSHLHMDHICGLYGFPLFLDPEAEIHLYGRGTEGKELEQQLGALIGRPCWPIGPAKFLAHVIFHEVRPGTSFSLAGCEADQAGLRVCTLEGNHPGGSIFYRLENDAKSIVYGLDCEINAEITNAARDFSREASLLIWDAHFTEEDLKHCYGWGHSSWRQGIKIGEAAQVQMVLMAHYSREYTDEFLKKQEDTAGQESKICRFAKEGMVLEL